MTYTYAILEVSHATYREIAKKLKAAGYDHAFHADSNEGGQARTVIDMHGIALAPTPKSFLFRPQRGGFDESMKEVQEFSTREELGGHLAPDVELISIDYYGFDDRNTWTTYIVKGRYPDGSVAPCGFTNGPVE